MRTTPRFPKMILSIVLAVLSVIDANAQSGSLDEHGQLTILLRQLDMMDRIAHESQSLFQPQSSRYYFDYPRFHADIQRIRTGIHDYLIPQRAQPRDPVELDGHYLSRQIQTYDEKSQP